MSAVFHRANGTPKWIVFEHEDGVWLQDNSGVIATHDIVEDLTRKMVDYAETCDAAICEHNKSVLSEIEAIGHTSIQLQSSSTSSRSKSCVYVMKCGGRYKVGVSDNVVRRTKELDNRPFKVSLVVSSQPMVHAYDAERWIHNHLNQYRLGGEWFDIVDADKVDNLIKVVSKLSDDDWKVEV